MAERKPDRLVVAVVLSRSWDLQRRVLVGRRTAGSAPGLAGLWEFPGGHVEDDEQPHEAAAREVAEEVGLIVRPDALRPIYVAALPWIGREDLRCACVFYAAQASTDALTLSAHSDHLWTSWAMLPALKLTPAAAALRAHLRQAP